MDEREWRQSLRGAGGVPLVHWLALAVIPVAEALGFGLFSRAYGPFWAGGTVDPTYAYLLNALLLAEGQAPFLSEHPGITVEAIGAVGIRVVHALAGAAAPLRDDVLTHPERFAVAINGILVAAMALANIFQGWAVRRLTGSWACVAAAQLAPFLSETVLLTGTYVMAEPLLLALGLVLSGAVALLLAEGTPAMEARAGVRLGVIVGLGVATKLLFAPLGLLPLVVLRRLRDRLVFVGAAALTLAVCLIPIAARLPAMVAYHRELANHTGAYGQGGLGLLDPEVSGPIIRELIAAEPLTHAVALIGALVGAVALARSSSGSPRRRLATVLVQISMDGVTAKHPPARPYYLTSGIALSGLCLALVLELGGSGAAPGRRSAVWRICSLSGDHR